MTEIFLAIIFGIIFLEYIVGWGVIIFRFFRYTVRCRHVCHCKNDKCRNRPYCKKIAFTMEEMERIQKQIREMKQKNFIPRF